MGEVSGEAEALLRQRLAEPVSEYVFECQYQGRKVERHGDNYKLEIMTFQNVYPKSGRIVPAYAAQISKMLRSYDP